MPFRILEYVVRVISRHVDEVTSRERLPLPVVIPVVVHHSATAGRRPPRSLNSSRNAHPSAGERGLEPKKPGQEAAWAARVAYEALDHFGIHSEDIDTNVPGDERRVLAHALVQAELARQLSDIQDLKMHASEPVPTAVARVRTRATADANRFLRS